MEKLRKELSSQNYQPKPTKKVDIPKPDGGVRSLGISSQRDKVVQAALLNLLEAKFEILFSNHSFGFRKGLGCHDALKQIKSQWMKPSFIINVDIEKCFDTIKHDKLIAILKKHVDQATLELIRKLISAGYVEMGDNDAMINQSNIGTPQGSLISPLLCNVYLNELDFYVESLLVEYNRGSERKYTSGYQARLKLSKVDIAFLNDYPERERDLKSIKHKRFVDNGGVSRDPNDASFRRLKYIRYADDFMLAFSGPKDEASQIYYKISKFLENDLGFKVNTGKSQIFHASDRGIMYLGTYMRYLPNKVTTDLHGLEVSYAQDSSGNGQEITPNTSVVNKTKNIAINKVQFRVPTDRLLKRAVSKKYAVEKENGSFRATSCRKWCGLEDAEIVLKFNAIIRGILNYYSFVQSKSDLWAIVSLYKKVQL